MSLTAIFDIGKTNKKFFLFDEHFQEVDRVYYAPPETTDEDGFPCDDLPLLSDWMQQTLQRALETYGAAVTHLNFSTYGATLVHLDDRGMPATAMYNYLKPAPGDLLDDFYRCFGGRDRFALETASPALGMLNAGCQLYWLKHRHPDRFHKIRTTLHFPQYCSYLFTRRPVADYTSLGCHTGLWDFRREDYHDWVRQEQLESLFPSLVPATTAYGLSHQGRTLRVGVGIHDSSAALLPYLYAEPEPFLLLSTGTWSIALNPFNRAPLSAEELARDCLNYLRPDGRPVKASRLFLGQEYAGQLDMLCRRYGVDPEAGRRLKIDWPTYRRQRADPRRYFQWQHLPGGSAPPAGDLGVFPTFEAAYHRLLLELVQVQVDSLLLARGATEIRKVFVDGGFAANELYLKMLAAALPEWSVIAGDASLGAALGAALAVRDSRLPAGFLQAEYCLKKQEVPAK